MKKNFSTSLSLAFLLGLAFSNNCLADKSNMCPEVLTAIQYKDFLHVGQSKVMQNGREHTFHFVENGTPSRLHPKQLKHLLKNTPRLASVRKNDVRDFEGYTSAQVSCEYTYYTPTGEIQSFSLVSTFPTYENRRTYG